MLEFIQHNLYTAAGLLQLVLSLWVAQSVISFGRYKKGNREFVNFMNYTAVVALVYVIRSVQPSSIWFMRVEQFVLAPLVFFLPFVYLYFISHLTDWEAWEKKWVRYVFLAPPLILLVIDLINPKLLYISCEESIYGFFIIPGKLANVYVIYSFIIALKVMLMVWKNADNTFFGKKGIYVFMFGNIMVLLVGSLTDIIIPQYVRNFPTLSFFSINIYTICLYSIIRMNQGLFDMERALIDFERLKYFNKTSSALDSDLRQDELLQLFIENTRKASGARSVFYMETSSMDEFRLSHYSSDLKSVLPRLIEYAKSRGIDILDWHNITEANVPFIEDILKTGKMHIVKSINAMFGGSLPATPLNMLQLLSGVKCFVAFPVTVKGQIRGILIFSLTRNETDFTIYHLFTNQCAQILRNHELLKSYRTVRDEQAILLNNITTQIWYVKDKDTFGYVNSAFATFYKLEESEIEGKPVKELIAKHPVMERLIPKTLTVFETKLKAEFEEWVINPAGDKRLLLITQTPKINPNGEIEYVVCVGNDITDFRKLENQVYQAQKMDAIGQLAGGVAHNFNNLLLSVMGYAELISGDSSDPRIVQFANRIILASQHGSSLSQQLLTFARKGKYEITKVDITQSVDQVIVIIESTFDKRIRIEKRFTSTNPSTTGDPSQLMQMLLNLALNARDAMPQGGLLRFTVEDSELDAAFCKKNDFAKPGRFLHIAVSDTGTGISKNVLPHIFEPFYTTKEIGKGFGLGLASVYGCVKNHNGYITLESKDGQGTQFNIYLPYSLQEWDSDKPDGLILEKSDRHNGRLMIIEDEEDVRIVTALTLRKAGYRVESFSNGPSALAFYKDHHSEVDVVLLDVTMPEMNGLECMKALMAINPLVSVIIASGHTFEGEPHLLVEKGARAFIQKPWKRQELIKIIDDVLAGKI